MTGYHLAQMNIAKARVPLDDPLMADFVANLDRINALADRSPGFVWRLQSDSGNATDIQAFDDPLVIVNMSLWRSYGELADYVYRSEHTKIMVRRREWFQPLPRPFLVAWWVVAGTFPTVAEGKARLDHLARHGATPHAFTLRERFPPPAEERAPAIPAAGS